MEAEGAVAKQLTPAEVEVVLTWVTKANTILAAGRADLCLLDPRLYEASG